MISQKSKNSKDTALLFFDFDYVIILFIFGSVLSFLIGGFKILLSFLLIFVSYFFIEDLLENFGFDAIFEFEIVTFACIIAAEYFKNVFAAIYIFFTLGIIKAVDEICWPEEDEMENPFGISTISFAFATLMITFFPTFSLLHLVILANLAKMLFRCFVPYMLSRDVENFIYAFRNIPNLLMNIGLVLIFSGLILH